MVIIISLDTGIFTSRQAQWVLTANVCKHGGLPDISVRRFQNQRQATALRRRPAQVSRRAPNSNSLKPLVLQPRQASRHRGARAKLQEGWGGRCWLERQHTRPQRPRTDRQMSRRVAFCCGWESSAIDLPPVKLGRRCVLRVIRGIQRGFCSSCCLLAALLLHPQLVCMRLASAMGHRMTTRWVRSPPIGC